MKPWKVNVSDKQDASDNLRLQSNEATTRDVDVSLTTPTHPPAAPQPVQFLPGGKKCEDRNL